jgi:hypothetical protein
MKKFTFKHPLFLSLALLLLVGCQTDKNKDKEILKEEKFNPNAYERAREFADKNGLVPVSHSDDDAHPAVEDESDDAVISVDNYSSIRLEFIDLYNNMVDSYSSQEETAAK